MAVIVVVDDDAFVRDLIITLLNRFPGIVHSFDAAFSAWEHLKRNRTDLLITDVNMDGMSGLELLRKVKQASPMTKCIIISGDPSHKDAALENGADAFLLKPFRTGEFIDLAYRYARILNLREFCE